MGRRPPLFFGGKISQKCKNKIPYFSGLKFPIFFKIKIQQFFFTWILFWGHFSKQKLTFWTSSKNLSPFN